MVQTVSVIAFKGDVNSNQTWVSPCRSVSEEILPPLRNAMCSSGSIQSDDHFRAWHWSCRFNSRMQFAKPMICPIWRTQFIRAVFTPARPICDWWQN